MMPSLPDYIGRIPLKGLEISRVCEHGYINNIVYMHLQQLLEENLTAPPFLIFESVALWLL